MNPIAKIMGLPPAAWTLGRRFFKFGVVGASGILVNLGALYLAQEFLFSGIQAFEARLNASLAFAIACATVNNFTWNRIWTWADRRQHQPEKSLVVQLGQYATACWLGILLQVVFTKVLVAADFHYLLANFLAIVAASVFNFVVNDHWTFGRLKLLYRVQRQLGSRAGKVGE
jgi:dolichol-phosphate mannosyltransferase